MSKRSKISCEELLKRAGRVFSSYGEEAAYINELLQSGFIQPIKNSGTNGKRPALFMSYWEIHQDRDYSDALSEVRFRLSPKIDISFYERHPDIYLKEREWVLPLSNYLKECQERLKISFSENERSFDIWGKEKYLSGKSEDGISCAAVLNHCGLSKEDLNVYRTAEPLAFYSCTKEAPQTILILENLDPFYSMRRRMLGGEKRILDTPIGTLIYGGGKRVSRAFQDFELTLEPYMQDERNRFIYAGDLDYEGIGIYESLAKSMEETARRITLFKEAYLKMLKKARGLELPCTKEGQRRQDGALFFSFFESALVKEMKGLLERGLYIPQEILSISDY